MAKTNEEIQKIVDKQFSSVTKLELSVYDQAKILLDAFTKETKALEANYKKELTVLSAEDKNIDKDLKLEQDKITKTFNEDIQKLETLKQQAVDLCEVEEKKHKDEHTKAVSDLEKQKALSEKTFQKAVSDLAKELKKNIDIAAKNILAIEEKGVKDQISFTQKIDDLKAKYEAKIEALNEKEQIKLAKVLEIFDKKVETIQNAILKEQEALNQTLVSKKALYEEELAEIDEKIDFEKTEFDRKHENIKDAADKRIQVREKHMQRAIAENDSRSAKQHKKDIAKFRKEADHDLVILEKNYTQQKQESADYRLNFIKDYLNEITGFNKGFSEFREGKQLEIDQLQIAINNDNEQIKLDFEQERADELNKFNSSFAQLREKQEQTLTQQKLDVEKEHLNEAVFNIEHDQQKAILEEEYKLTQEEYVKTEKLLDFNHQKLVELSQYKKQETLLKLSNEADVKNIQYTYDQTEKQLQANMRHHAVEDKRHTAQKDEYVAFQEQLAPLYTKRVESILDYEQSDIQNRLELKTKFYEAQQVELDKTYAKLEDKLEEEFKLQAIFYEEKIELLAGEKEVSFQAFVDANEKELRTLQSKIDTLVAPQERKEKKELEALLEQKRKVYQDEKSKQEKVLQTLVGPYKAALKDIADRKQKAIKDIKELHQTTSTQNEAALTLYKEHCAAELSMAKAQLETTQKALNQFALQLASRREQQTTANKNYLEAQLQAEEQRIKDANIVLESSRESLAVQLTKALQELQQKEQSFMASNNGIIHDEEARLESFTQKIKNAIAAIKEKANNAILLANNAFTAKKNTLDQEYNHTFSQINTTLQTQVADYNQVTADIKKRKTASSTLLESEQKRVKKECDIRIKEDLLKIDSDAKVQLQSLL